MHRISRPAHAVVVAAVIEKYGDVKALEAIVKAHELAEAAGRARPTAKLYVQAAADIGCPVVEADESDAKQTAEIRAAWDRTQKTVTRLVDVIKATQTPKTAAEIDLAESLVATLRAQAAELSKEISRAKVKTQIDKRAHQAIPAAREESVGAEPVVAAT
ncbi:hypothetical protein [Streptomyces sp. NPDC054865]